MKEKIKDKFELFTTITITLICVWLWISIPNQIKDVELTKPDYIIKVTSRSFPKLAIILIFLSSVIETIRLVFSNKNTKEIIQSKELNNQVNTKKQIYTEIHSFLVIILSLLFFTFILPKFGFLISGFLLCSWLTYYFKGTIFQSILVGIIVPFVLYYIFKFQFFVALPRGIIPF
jgi:uncharacterized protein YqhQ